MMQLKTNINKLNNLEINIFLNNMIMINNIIIKWRINNNIIMR